MPVMDAIDEFPTSCGQVAWDALPKIKELLHACRDAEIPVVYSTSDPDFKAAFGNATKRGVDKTDFEKLAVEFPDDDQASRTMNSSCAKPAPAHFSARI